MILQYPAVVLLLQSEMDILSVFSTTSLTARIVLAVLLIFSVASWGIILSKTLLLRRVRKESDVFWKIFRKGQNLSEIATAADKLDPRVTLS